MKNLYYSLPITLNKVTKKDDCVLVSLAESVSNMLHLITISKFGECKHDNEFGCAIWDHDFDTITNMQSFKENIKISIEEAVATYEKRLSNIIVEVSLSQAESVIKKRRVKNRINILIRGKLVKTNEEFNWEENFFIGPLSYY